MPVSVVTDQRLKKEDSNKENRAFNDGSSDGSEGGVNQAGRGFSRQASGDKPHRGGRGGRRGRGGRGSSGNRGGGFVKHTGFLVDQTSAFTSDDDFNKNGWDHGQNFDAPLNGSSGSEPVWQKKPGPTDLSSQGTEERVLVVHVENPLQFWSQIIVTENAEELQRISEQLQRECPRMQPVLGQLTLGQIYGSKFSVDQQWYRCKVEKHLPEFGNKIQVRYIDYGNCEIVEQGTLVTLPPDLASCKPCAQLYQLSGVDLVDSHCDSEQFKKGMQNLLSLINEEIVYVTIVKAAEIPEVSAAVARDGKRVNVIQEMLNSGAVVQKQVTSDTKPDSSNASKRTLAARFSGNNKVNATRESGEINEELESRRGEVLQLKRKNALLEKELQRSLKSGSHSKFMKLLDKVKMLKDFRGNVQIEGLPVSLQLAIDLTLDENKSIRLSRMAQYQELSTAKEVYLKFQSNLKDLKDKESIDDVAKQRDQARADFVDKIDTFLNYSDGLQIASRLKELENALCELRKRYTEPSGGTGMSVKEAVNAYEEWRVSKMSEIKGLQDPTNQCSVALASAMEGLTQRINLFAETLIAIPVDTEVEDIDQLCEQYENAISTEISKTKEANIDVDCKQKLKQVVNSVFGDMNREIEDIKHLRNGMQEEYISEKADLEHWLTKRPDVSKLHTIRKTLKKLKLKFKHKQVDREDLEEGSDPEDKTNLEKIEEELYQIRLDLQGVLCEENKQMKELAKITEKHFPELPLQYPDIGMTSYLETGGLLQAREIEHYSHHAMPVISPSNKQPIIFKTSFDQKPCVLKKYSLGEKCDKESLKSRMVSYKKCKHENLMPLDGLFFDKSEREAYLQTPFYEEGNLRQFIKSNPSHEEIRELLHDLLKGLACLESNGYIHGAIKPENVFVERKDGKIIGVIGEPNFFKGHVERFQELSQYSTSSSYPTLQLGAENMSSSLDVFCLGLCVFWAYTPDADHPDDLFRNVDSIMKDLDGSLKDFLDCLLTRVPSLRISANDALRHAFFEFGLDLDLQQDMSKSRDSNSPSEELINTMNHLMENVTPVPEEKEPLQTPDNPQDSEATDRSES